jgi:imidazolonepropionase-like amidohydrolase
MPACTEKPYLWSSILAALSALCGSPSPAEARTSSKDATAITGVRIYRSPEATPIERGVVLVRDGRIQAVGREGELKVPTGYRVLERRGKVLTAGYYNLHVHLTTPVFLTIHDRADAEVQGELERAFTRWGFTTVFDLASTSAIASSIERRLDAGSIAGPRVLSVAEPFYPANATPIYARQFYSRFNLPSAEIQDQRSSEARVRSQLARGADGIKLFTGSIVGENRVVHMPPDDVLRLAQAARRSGKPVFAHPTDRLGVEIAVRNGVSALAHSAPLMGPWSDELARSIAKRGVALIPTLSLFALQPHPSTPVEVAVQQVRTFSKNGGTILFGTDAGFTETFDTTEELRLLGAGIGWKGVLAALTSAPARFLGEARRRGTVDTGKVADLVLLDADPAVDVRNFAKVSAVFREGRQIYGEARLSGRRERGER